MLGDFDPDRSDLDVQAVSEDEVPRRTLERLAAELSEPALPCPARGLELVVYTRAGLRHRRGPAFALNLNTGPAIEHHQGLDPDAEPRFWFTIDVSIARQRGRSLAGPAPAVILPELPRPLVLAALRDSLAWHRSRDPAAAVLAACRGWAWASEGRWLSKAEAARWAVARLDDRRPVDRALARRDEAGRGPAPREAATVVAHVDRQLGMLAP
ncbi:MAG TPA: aminoglycoside adenylyltransferase domain-containing protein [Solirubrobacterales bacterium]|nr:aminoglycoside adenylyltransferase domain-containing protein [Solirubrobacterales bacterium]